MFITKTLTRCKNQFLLSRGVRSYNKTNQTHQFLKFIFGIKSLHISDSSSVHHQFFHCAHSNGICHTGLLTAHESQSCQQNCMKYQCLSTAGLRPGTAPWHQLYRAMRDSPGIGN